MHGRRQNAPKVSDFYPLRTVPLYGWKTLISNLNMFNLMVALRSSHYAGKHTF